jgi:catechol 2,3-dioxygenase-like lactoylglutathione lyase family enzyme
MSKATFQSASPYQNDVLGLPVVDLNAASAWYSIHFGLTEIERLAAPVPTVIMERDGTRIGFAVNDGDAAQDGAAIQVVNIVGLKEEFAARGTPVVNWRIDNRDGQRYQVFFVVAPDGLCYYFYELVAES